jgi:uncharacterized protein YdhG (YjbR/CyaY superfamily)
MGQQHPWHAPITEKPVLHTAEIREFVNLTLLSLPHRVCDVGTPAVAYRSKPLRVHLRSIFMMTVSEMAARRKRTLRCSWELQLRRRHAGGFFGRKMVRMRKATAAKPHPAQTVPSEAVEAYIAAVPEPVRTALRQLREIIRSAVPAGASEVISYGIPAFSLAGKSFFGYAAFKSHLSVLPFSGSLFDSFAEELETYSRTKSSLHLPFDRPLPAPLIRRLVHARVAALSRKANDKGQVASQGS